MKAYFVKYYGEEFALIRMEAPGKLNDGGARAWIYQPGGWKESPDHVNRVLYTGEYDEITEAEAVKLKNRMRK